MDDQTMPTSLLTSSGSDGGAVEEDPVNAYRDSVVDQGWLPSFQQAELWVWSHLATIGFSRLLTVSLAIGASISAPSSTLSTTNRGTSVTTIESSADVSDSPTHTVNINGTATEFRSIFTLSVDSDQGQPLIPNVLDPEAVDPQSVCPGYKASNVVRTDVGMTATLNLAGTACNVYGTDIESLNLTVEYQSGDRLHVEIVPTHVDASNTSHYILPENLVTKPGLDADAVAESVGNDLSFVYSNDPSFSFTVLRHSTGDVLFSTMGRALVFENQFIEFGSDLPESYNIYGLGEVVSRFKLHNNLTRTMFNADVGDPVDENIYGTHPFYLDTRYYKVDSATGNTTLLTSNETDPDSEYVSYSHGVYLRNSHPQEVLTRPTNITWRTIGGSIDLYFYAGPSQPEVTKSYIKSAAGLPAMQQYFTFGFHQCRWGYANWTQLQEVVDTFEAFGIPLENIWLDIDYMNQYRNFETDQVRFSYAEGREFLSKLHDGGRHWIPIIDSAIYVPNPTNESDVYPTFTNGFNSDAFMKNPDGSLYIGSVWPGYTVYPDWLSEGGVQWWVDEMKNWHDMIAFDGVWIDMSEVSSFCVGSCGSGNLLLNPVHPPFALPGEPGNMFFDYPEGFSVTNATEASAAASASSSQAAAALSSSSTTTSYRRTKPTPGVRDINYPPYVIKNVNSVDLAVHTVSPNATHQDGTLEYDIHNLFGTQILNATYQGLLNISPTKRPFIIGRSTFVGSGVHAGHWGGDNYSQWAYMFFSIPQALSFSLFGIPMFGVDTCGFVGNADEELCNRWMQLSAFFPFYRNHNAIAANSQEPYIWASVIDASKTAIQIRYSILPYIYTLFYEAHTTGSTVMRALAWEFPTDPSLAAADRQFLLGPALLITPVLTPGATSVNGVFPGAGKGGEVWYDWYSHGAITAHARQNLTIAAPLGHIPLFVRGGYVLPMQEPAMTTRAARQNPWGLLAALSLNGTAAGSLYVDDGESITPNATLWVTFTVSKNKLYAAARGGYVDTNPLANVTVLGVETAVRNVSLNGVVLGSPSAWTWNETSKALEVTGLRDATAGGAWTSDWVLEWI